MSGTELHEQAALVFGTLGAISFAALVLILQDPTPFKSKAVISGLFTPDQNLDILVVMLALSSVLAIFSSVSGFFVASKMARPTFSLTVFSFVTGLLSFTLLVLSIADAVAAITPIGSDILVAVVGPLVVILWVVAWRARSS